MQSCHIIKVCYSMQRLSENLVNSAETEPKKEEEYTKKYIQDTPVRELIRETMNSLHKRTITLEFYQRIWKYKQAVEKALKRKGLTQLQRDVEEVFDVRFD